MELNRKLREIAAIEGMNKLASDWRVAFRFADLAARWEFDDDDHTKERFRKYVGKMAHIVSRALNTDVHILYGTTSPFGFGFKIYGIEVYAWFKVEDGGFVVKYKLM